MDPCRWRRRCAPLCGLSGPAAVEWASVAPGVHAQRAQSRRDDPVVRVRARHRPRHAPVPRRTRIGRQDRLQRRDDLRIELGPRTALQLIQSHRRPVRHSVRAVRGHGAKRIGHGDEARPQRDRRALQPLRIAVPVPALMMRPDQGGNRPQRRHAPHHVGSYYRVLAHQRPLLRAQPGRLLQHGVGDRNLAHIMQPSLHARGTRRPTVSLIEDDVGNGMAIGAAGLAPQAARLALRAERRARRPVNGEVLSPEAGLRARLPTRVRRHRTN